MSISKKCLCKKHREILCIISPVQTAPEFPRLRLPPMVWFHYWYMSFILLSISYLEVHSIVDLSLLCFVLDHIEKLHAIISVKNHFKNNSSPSQYWFAAKTRLVNRQFFSPAFRVNIDWGKARERALLRSCLCFHARKIEKYRHKLRLSRLVLS